MDSDSKLARGSVVHPVEPRSCPVVRRAQGQMREPERVIGPNRSASTP
jgi:hypothetical protein